MPNKTITSGSRVTLEMDLYLEDGELVASTKEDGALTATVGNNEIIPGLEEGLMGKASGDTFDIEVEPEQGYGEYDEDAFDTIPLEMFEDADIEVGEDFFFEDEDGEPVVVRIEEIDGDEVVVDFNHPLAGETLRYKGTIVKVE